MQHKYNEELHQKLYDLLSQGNYVETSCNMVGITKSTFYYWYNKGKAGDERYIKFYKDMLKATGNPEIDMIQSLRELALGLNGNPPDFRAIQYFLRCRKPQHWNESTRIEALLDRQARGLLDQLKDRLPEETYNTIVDIIGYQELEDID